MILRYFIKKIIYALSILFGVASLIFFIFNILPGDPARMTLGQRTDSISLSIVKKDLGLDKPLFIRYVKYINDLSPISVHTSNSPDNFFYFDPNIYKHSVKLLNLKNRIVVIKFPYLRRSFQSQRNVTEMILNALPATLVLAFVSIVIAGLFGIFLGIVAAIYKNTWIDRLLIALAAIGVSLPSFFAAIIIAFLFAYVWQKYTGLPLTGSLFEIDDSGNGSYLAIKNIILPALTLGIRPLSVVTQLMRNSLLDVMSMDYIRTARAKGLSQMQVILRHGLRNALNPVVTSLSGWFASMMAGVVFIEYIFSWKGLGYLMVNALLDFDLPVVMGGVLTTSCIFILVNILTDITYAWLDPRIRNY